MPILGTLMLSASVGVVEAHFVGEFSTREPATMVLALPRLMLAIGVAIGIGTGVWTVAERAIGLGFGDSMYRAMDADDHAASLCTCAVGTRLLEHQPRADLGFLN